MTVKVTRQLVIRDTDGQPLLLIAAHLAGTTVLLQVIELPRP